MLRLPFLSLALVATPVFAQGYFSAEPVTPPADQRFVARENVWQCNGAACSSARSASRPAIVCSTLVRQVGALKSFTVDGRALAAEELADCNSRAR